MGEVSWAWVCGKNWVVTEMMDDEVRGYDEDAIALEGITNTFLDEKINLPPKNSSSHHSNIHKQNNENCCCGANTMITFFDNIRAIFSQGRSSEENCKYQLIVAIASESNKYFIKIYFMKRQLIYLSK